MTAGGGPGAGRPVNTDPDGCAPGTTIQTAGLGNDVDEDDKGGPSDGDGCV